MAGSRKHILPSVLLLLCLYSGTALYAQDTGDENYFVQRDGEELRFMQRLSWGHDPLVLRYQVIIEEQQNGRNTEILRRSVQENSLDVSLRPGQYRYQVRVYNLLGKLEYTMPWTAFEVLPALQPKIQNIAPVESQGQITIEGENITPEADIVLRPRGGGPDIRPRHLELDGDTARIVFDEGQLEPGEYDVIIKNPGGLADSRETFIVQAPEPLPEPLPEPVPEPQPLPEPEVEIAAAVPEESEEPEAPEVRSPGPGIAITLGYGPLIPLYGKFFDVFDKFIDPLGAYARFSVIPLMQPWGTLGLEIEPFWNLIAGSRNESSVTSHLIGGHINLLYQRGVRNNIIVINGRLGAGITAVLNYHYTYSGSDSFSFMSYYISAGAGASVQWFIRRPFFLELGIEYNHIFTMTDPTQPGYLRPVAGAGVQF
jgi:hypothetical protein